MPKPFSEKNSNCPAKDLSLQGVLALHYPRKKKKRKRKKKKEKV